MAKTARQIVHNLDSTLRVTLPHKPARYEFRIRQWLPTSTRHRNQTRPVSLPVRKRIQRGRISN
jgi:hypothetical protein